MSENKNESKTELAEDRTEFAQERTDLARERTFSSWARTGLTCVAGGLGIARLLKSVTHTWIATTIGIILVLTGATIFVVGYLSYKKIRRSSGNQLVAESGMGIITVITGGLILSSLLGMWLLFQETE